MRKSVIYKSAAVAVALMSGQQLWAGVNPVTVQGWETGVNIPTTTDVGWYGNVVNAPLGTDGTTTTNVGWEVPGGGNAANTSLGLTVAHGSVGSPATGATEGVNSLQVVHPANTGFTYGAEYQVNSSYQGYLQGMGSSNLIEFDITLPTALPANVPSLGVDLAMDLRGTDGSDFFLDGYNNSDNRGLSDPGFAQASTGTHTSIWNYGAWAQDFLQTGIEITNNRFYTSISIASNSGTSTGSAVTYYIDNIRFASRQLTWTGGTGANLSDTGNWNTAATGTLNGVTSQDDSGELENQQADSATNHPEINDVLHFAGTANTTVNNNMGSFAAAGAYPENSQFSGLVFDAGAAAFTINGNAIDLAGDGIIDPTTSGDIINNSSNIQTINVPIRLLNNVTIRPNSGSLVFSKPISQITAGGGGNTLGPYGVTFAGAGSTTLSAANTWTSFTNVFSTLNIAATGSIATTSNSVGTGGTINVAVGATPGLPTASVMTLAGNLNFSNSLTGIKAVSLNTIALNAGGKVTLANPGAGNSGNRLVLVTPNLNFTGTTGNWTGIVDLTANDMIIQGGAANLANIVSQLQEGYHGGAWNGAAGILSSAAATSTSPKTALGYASRSGTFDGQTVTTSDVIVKYTVLGDADLSGSVNFSDLLVVAQHYNGTNTTWTTGDFTYDGKTNFNDLLALAQNYNKGIPALSASQVSQLDSAGGASFAAAFAQAEAQVAVPEPGTISVLALGSIGLLNRRRRVK